MPRRPGNRSAVTAKPTAEKIRDGAQYVIPAISILSTLIVAVASIVANIYLQRNAVRTAFEQKKYEITFLAKQKAYADFARVLTQCYDDALAQKSQEIITHSNEFDATCWALEPFIKDPGARAQFRRAAWEIESSLWSLANLSQRPKSPWEKVDGVPGADPISEFQKQRDDVSAGFLKRRDEITRTLYQLLFDQ